MPADPAPDDIPLHSMYDRTVCSKACCRLGSRASVGRSSSVWDTMTQCLPGLD
jgi:hypothetical protein